MSKNVAVFVDVANIFYAAKAAGVDIDYTTLLKTATAGRDFVRAYAYTGLDPENENQRQFHAFLARSGYKVVSKDIRKYGDGRVKANLDIELVVDMMRTAQNLDIAVVVSGDGDFAPAIRAVQQMGVRVEVISFRGNTSSDLIDVADTFIDITQIARVEKGSSRSGRRVAAEDDLSMTEVPDKESEGAARGRGRGRGRGRAAEREEAAPPAAASSRRRTTATGADLVVLPGEKLSRVPGGSDEPELDGADVVADELDEELEVEVAASDASPDVDGDGEVDGDGRRRRRRRRGGRGRGRGRGQDRETPVEAAAPTGTADDGEDEEEDDLTAYDAPRAPQATAFGSVWDSQIGVPAASSGVGADFDADAEDEDEPEIPEYLLAERRQRAGRPGGRQAQGGRGRPRGGRAGAYQSAIDRERYGRSGGSAFGGAPRPDRGPRPDRTPRHAGPRSDRAPRADRPPMRPSSGNGDPWSEVPPELEEMLRAELARKGPATGGSADAADAKPQRRTSSRKPAAATAETATVEAADAAEAKPKRRTSTRKPAAATAETATVEAADAAEVKPKRRTSTRKPAATAETATVEAADAAEAKPKRRTSTRKAATPEA
ncbi:MAG TPA: NYN domain-containing protein [Candidatus Limnocylindrales bacterium]